VCQLQNHPLYLLGFGLEDLATCECVFAGSNPATRLIRHASYFHWLQFIDLQFDQWDKDKYAELSNSPGFFFYTTNDHFLGNFLLNNYKQALSIIINHRKDIDALKEVLPRLRDEDFIQWRIEELHYLKTLQVRPEFDEKVVEYVAALEALAKAQCMKQSCGFSDLLTAFFCRNIEKELANFVNLTAQDFTNGKLSQSSHKAAQSLEAERTRVHRRILALIKHADSAERALEIDVRWKPTDLKYIEALAFIKNRTFIRAAEQLEGLVVQRLFELSKANLAGTGVLFSK
jgi:hypothetical protein